MSADIAISVENLGKSYMVGHQSRQAERYTALRDVIARNVRGLARKTNDMLHGRPIVQGECSFKAPLHPGRSDLVEVIPHQGQVGRTEENPGQDQLARGVRISKQGRHVTRKQRGRQRFQHGLGHGQPHGLP